jgi:oxygen-independent coproporphyrinogen III oxidase
MKIKINNQINPKHKIAINKLLKSFDYHGVISDEDYDHQLTIESLVRDDDMIATVSLDGVVYENRQVKNHMDEDDLIKYTILGAVYLAFKSMYQKSLEWGLLTGIRPTKLVHQSLKSGLTFDEIKQLLTHTYFLSEDKTTTLIDVVRYQLSEIKDYDTLENEISVYINIPYCLSRCTYCSFTSYHKDKTIITPNDYLDHLVEEISEVSAFIKENRIKITTIYIGGGTPTALSSQELVRLLSAVDQLYEGQTIREFTLESGRPDSLDSEKLAIINHSRVTRISINPQTFNEETLKKVNRSHNTADVERLYKEAKAIGISNINMDLIVGLPGETNLDVKHSINETLRLDPESVTIHALALKKGSDLIKTDLIELTKDYDQSFQYIRESLTNQAYKPYYLYRQKNMMSDLENIGYCKEGYLSLYNVLMIEEKQTIIGLGCGASSKFLDYDIILNPKDLKTYCDRSKWYLDKKLTKLNELMVKK